MKRTPAILFAALTAALGACADLSKPDRFGNVYDAENFGTSHQNTYPQGGYTYATSSIGHGIQIEYFTIDGRAYLWYPTNKSRSLPGRWRETADAVCFAYDVGSYNPVTEEHFEAGDEDCVEKGRSYNIISRIEGDPFDLAGGRLPIFDLNRCRLPEPMKLTTSTWSCEPRKPEPLGPGYDVESSRTWSNYFSCLVHYVRQANSQAASPEEIARSIHGACAEHRDAYKADRLSRYPTQNAKAFDDFSDEVDRALYQTAFLIAVRSQEKET